LKLSGWGVRKWRPGDVYDPNRFVDPAGYAGVKSMLRILRRQAATFLCLIMDGSQRRPGWLTVAIR
jgi:hypothetical protein